MASWTTTTTIVIAVVVAAGLYWVRQEDWQNVGVSQYGIIVEAIALTESSGGTVLAIVISC